jgi:hypothetical protein
MPTSHRIRQVRIDVPLRTTCAYLFVDPEQAKWDPWWGELYELLLQLAPAQMSWQHEPMQGVYVARPELTVEQRKALSDFLRSAPERQMEEHRTLRRAVELTSEQVRRLEVVYFSAGPAAK